MEADVAAVSFCLLLAGHVVPLIDAAGDAGGEASGSRALYSFPDAADAARAVRAHGAVLVDFYELGVAQADRDTTTAMETAAEGEGEDAAAVMVPPLKVRQYLAYTQ